MEFRTINLRWYAIILCLAMVSTSVFAQIGINTTNPANGALLDINSSSKGFLLPKVTLTSTSDITTISPSATVGLLVYNTATAGVLPFQVTPGLYYWDGSQWLRFYNRGYGLKFDQGPHLNATSSYSVIPGLDTGNITIPYSGTYQIKVDVFYSCGNLSSTTSDGAGQASVALMMDTNNSGTLTNVEDTYINSSSKRIGSTTVNSLPQSTTIIYTVNLDVLNTYRFVAQGMEWSTHNVASGRFGRSTGSYSGSSGVTDAQDGAISITLIRQQ